MLSKTRSERFTAVRDATLHRRSDPILWTAAREAPLSPAFFASPRPLSRMGCIVARPSRRSGPRALVAACRSCGLLESEKAVSQLRGALGGVASGGAEQWPLGRGDRGPVCRSGFLVTRLVQCSCCFGLSLRPVAFLLALRDERISPPVEVALQPRSKGSSTLQSQATLVHLVSILCSTACTCG